jgi:hypothetical protein
MATIHIAIDAFAEHSDEVIHYEFTWTGNEKEARAVIKHVEGTTVGHGLKPGNLAHGTLRRLNEIPISATPSEDDDSSAGGHTAAPQSGDMNSWQLLTQSPRQRARAASAEFRGRVNSRSSD